MSSTRTKGKTLDAAALYGGEKISKILFKLAPPVMLAQLIQALYNVIDSLFVGRYSDAGLTALSIVYPLQLLMIALAVGTGVGINTVMAAKLGTGHEDEADEYAGVGTRTRRTNTQAWARRSPSSSMRSLRFWAISSCPSMQGCPRPPRKS